MAATRIPIRCFCKEHPLIAMAGRDASNKPFVHVKTWKGKRLYAEVIVTDGIAHVRCRICLRWHTIRIVKTDLAIKHENLPETLVV